MPDPAQMESVHGAMEQLRCHLKVPWIDRFPEAFARGGGCG